MNNPAKDVFASTELEPHWNNTQVVTEDAIEHVSGLKKQAGEDMIVKGGARFPRSLVGAGLVDESRSSFIRWLWGRVPRFRS
jgi:dihydrofolate reductase